MPYILYNTNGSQLITVDDGTVDDTTSLTFVGRNYSGYGQIQNQNFVYLLENFSNASAPSRPLQGQLWFNNNTNDRNLNICYDGVNFKPLANLTKQSADPALSSIPNDGDLWWNTTSVQLNTWSAQYGKWITIGPYNSVESVASWQPVTEIDGNGNIFNVLKGYIGSDPVVVISDFEFQPTSSSDLYTNFITVKSGITLKEADSSGSTQANDYYLWGTASDSLRANTATNVAVNVVTTGTFYLPFLSSASGEQTLYSTSTLNYNVSTYVLNATATAAQYADLAERYEADAIYTPGTVLVLGGEKEVTVTTNHADTAVIGVVSTKPAYLMNSDVGNDETHPAIALKGRVPCKVTGPINKGDLLVTSWNPGYAEVYQPGGDEPNAVFAKAIGTNAAGTSVIEVLIL
jgi:hypothetical protein